ncbi:hypothetical protein H4R24_002842 [Coemansia sp. RSA 988]|nr:hypothetical protein H4R24_002842 [Coemansia sp. RSA 988]
MANASGSPTRHKKKSSSLLKFFGKSDVKDTTTREVNTLATTCAHDIEGHVSTGSPPLLISSIAEKPLPAECTAIAFRNGKIAFHEKKLNLERHPSVIAAVFGFHQYVAQLQRESSAGLPLQGIPREHWSLVAMLIQERDVTVSSLVRSIESQLCPVVFGEDSASNADILAAGAVERAIALIAENKNYGVPLGELHCSSGSKIDEVPQGLSINRWEVNDMGLLPQDVREVVSKRRRRREQTHARCVQWFRSLEALTREQILTGTLKRLKGGTQSGITKGSTNTNTIMTTGASSGGHIDDGSGAIEGAAAFTLPKKIQPTIRGQRSLQMFFATDRPCSPVSQPEKKKDYYRAAFLPFNVRDCAHVYRFQPSTSFDLGNIDKVLAPSLSEDGAYGDRPQISELLAKFITLSQPERRKARARLPVCDGIDLDEAELCLMRLRMAPIKLVQFHGNRRPAYLGTCSKTLQHVSGRRPFVQDTNVLDYDIDSDAEWEAEDEDGEDLQSEEDDDDDDDDEDDDDFDEESGFVVGEGDALPRLGGLTDDSDVDESDFNSEDESVEEVNPDEEVVCVSDIDVNDMDVDGAGVCAVDTPGVAIGSMGNCLPAPKKSTRRPKHGPQLQRRRKVVPLTPVVVGLVFDKADPEQSNTMDICSSTSENQPLLGEGASKTHLLDSLTVFTIGNSMPLCISTDPDDMWVDKKGGDIGGEPNSNTDAAGAGIRRGKIITEDDLGALVRIVHESPLGVSRLVEELKHAIPKATKAQIERLIYEHAKKERRPATTRLLWYVNSELVSKITGLGISGCTRPPSDSSSSAFPESAPKRQRITDSLEQGNGAL